MQTSKKKIVLSLTVSVVLSAGGLILAFRSVPFGELLDYLATINFYWVAPACVFIFLSFGLRALRWRIILESTGDVGFWSAFHPLMTAFMINCVLPGRAGEIARPVILKKKERIPFSAGLATVAAERAFDIAMILLLFVAVLLFVEIDPHISIPVGSYQLNKATLETIAVGMVRLVLAMSAGIVLLSFQVVRKAAAGMIMKVPSFLFFAGEKAKNRIEERICRPAVRVMENFASGFALVKSPGKLAACIFLTVLVWSFGALSYYVFALGCPGVELTLPEMTAVMVIICLFIALPSVPGYWGLWEAGGMFAMTLFKVAPREAAGFTLANHALQVFPVILVGALSAFITGVNILKASYPEAPE